MKKFILVAMLALLLGSVDAAPIFGDHEFTDWDDFGGMFGKLYRDAIEVDNEEICKRTLQWPQFVEDDEPVFSQEDCLEFAEEGMLTDFANIKAGSKTDIDRWVQLMGLKFAYERQLWQQEMSLHRKLALGQIWVDGDFGGEEVTSPIDLVVRWNEIDEILHGEKATYPSFEALKESGEDMYDTWAEKPNTDEWLSQTLEDLPEASDYPDGEESFAGGFDEQQRNFNDIASNSLIPSYPAPQTFHIPFEGVPVPTSIQMNVDTVPTPAVSADEVEQDSVRKLVPFGELQGVFAEFFEEQTAVELRDAEEDSTRSDWLHQLFSVDQEQTGKDLNDRIEVLLRNYAETEIADGGQVELVPLLQWNIILETWIENLGKWKRTTEVFLTNPKK